jgi:RNA polymerase sigma-70 factor (ECF subfamily)
MAPPARDPTALTTPRPAPRGRELDEATLARAQAGDPAACRALLGFYQGQVFALLGRMLGRRGQRNTIEDLAQETFLRAFRALPGFDRSGPARLSTWLLTIATRLALDQLRRAPLPLLPLAAAQGRAAAERADDGVVRRGLAAAIAGAVERLSPEYRAAFVLRECHEMECSEIAAVLEIEPDTVRSRLARARAALREALAEMHDD